MTSPSKTSPHDLKIRSQKVSKIDIYLCNSMGAMAITKIINEIAGI
jgi:hypothetical protein